MTRIPDASFSFGALTEPVRARLEAWEAEDFGRRLWDRDHKLWSAEPVPELTDRLGWLTLPNDMRALIPELKAFAEEIRREADHVVLLGMGGSSLAPEVFQATFGNTAGYPELVVLDSTHPGAVVGLEESVDLDRSVFVVASKSGGTLETISFFRYFWERVAARHDRPGERFIALTDPGSKLETMATESSFRRVFSTPAEVGGRYSALTPFGLVPAALIGVDLEALIDSATAMAGACGADVAASDNPGLRLGAALGEAALSGRDKVTYVVSPSLASFPAWIEQLVAESTGKEGRGIVPVAGERLGAHEVYGADRLFVHIMVAGDDPLGQPAALEVLQAAGHPVVRIVLDDVSDLGAELFRNEMAVAAAGSILGINPFDQPDVQVAKDLARQAISPQGLGVELSEVHADDALALAESWESWTGSIEAGDYIGIHAYLPMGGDTDDRLERLQSGLRDRHRVAVTLGHGPRFLHSTGQLHKGGADNGVFLQLVDQPGLDLEVPGSDFTFDRLVMGQSEGDYQALQDRGRRLLRVNLGPDPDAGLDNLLAVTDV